MIPQLGFGETLVIVLLAIIVVGPKDLPMLMRKVGGFMRQVKDMGREFRDAFDEMGAEAEIEALRSEIRDLRKTSVEDPDLVAEMTALDTTLRDSARLDPK